MAETSVELLDCAIATAGLLKIDQIGSGVGVILYSPTQKRGAGLDGMHYELDDGVVQGLGLQEDDITAIMVEMVESAAKVVSGMGVS